MKDNVENQAEEIEKFTENGFGSSATLDDTEEQEIQLSGREKLEIRLKMLLTRGLQDPKLPADMAAQIKKINLKKMVIRFRILCRCILNATESKSLDDYLWEEFPEPTNVPVFDVSAYKRTLRTMHLSAKVRTILIKPPEFRTSDEIELVKQEFHTLPFFQKYSPDTHYELARALTYQYIPADRSVVKQGHKPVCFYFIISGGFSANILEKDLDTGLYRTRRLGDLKPGVTYGEIALIHNVPRANSVNSKYNSEVLLLFKEDFDNILRTDERSRWYERYNFIKNLGWFKNWSKDQLKEFNNNCKTSNFEDSMVILGNIRDFPHENLFFIVKGECKIVEIVRLVQKCGRISTFSMPPISMNSDILLSTVKPPCTIVKRLLNIMTLKKGQYFGTGEDLRQRYIVSSGQTEIISIPHIYLKRRQHLTWLELLNDNYNKVLPTHNQVFEEFIQRVAWTSYKRNLLQNIQLTHDKGLSTAKLSDVPLSIKRKEKVEKWTLIQQ